MRGEALQVESEMQQSAECDRLELGVSNSDSDSDDSRASEQGVTTKAGNGTIRKSRTDNRHSVTKQHELPRPLLQEELLLEALGLR
jgi:hypothetical protein